LGKRKRLVPPGTSSFSCIQRKERTGRNLRSGKEIRIPAKTSVKFSVVAAMKEMLNPSNARSI
jgi:DNA-binding protein HU-beta